MPRSRSIPLGEFSKSSLLRARECARLLQLIKTETQTSNRSNISLERRRYAALRRYQFHSSAAEESSGIKEKREKKEANHVIHGGFHPAHRWKLATTGCLLRSRRRLHSISRTPPCSRRTHDWRATGQRKLKYTHGRRNFLVRTMLRYEPQLTTADPLLSLANDKPNYLLWYFYY